jgi:hypothetical protein
MGVVRRERRRTLLCAKLTSVPEYGTPSSDDVYGGRSDGVPPSPAVSGVGKTGVARLRSIRRFDMALFGWTTRRVLIVVRTYPVPATKGIEVSCTAAITKEGEWTRLFRVPDRFLDDDKRFKKYQWIDVQVRRAKMIRGRRASISMPRPSKLQVPSCPLATRGAPGKDVVFPLEHQSLCQLDRARERISDPRIFQTSQY